MIAGFSVGCRAGGGEHDNATAGAFGLAMVFVLLTYGGWNEAAYLTGEFRDVRSTIARTLPTARRR